MAAAGLRADGCFLCHPAGVVKVIGVLKGTNDAVPRCRRPGASDSGVRDNRTGAMV